jgi:2-(1,2-epoxy-1,2-dihydrophenyl)acetyl-CoA isomerase
VSGPLLVERRADVLELTLHRPEALNAFTVDMHRGLADALREAADPGIRAVILTGAGRAFCGGQDLEEATAPDSQGPGHRLGTYYNPNLLALRALEKPVIAAVNGAAAGAGMGLALACDLRLLAEGATFVPAFSAIGLVPDSGTSWLTVALLGSSRAFAWLTSGRRMGTDEALALGLADEVVPVEDLLDRARARADALAALPGRSVELTKRLLQVAGSSTLSDQLDLERELQQAASEHPAYRERVAAFLARRGA